MDLDHILGRSRASDHVKAAVRALASNPFGYHHAGCHVSCVRPAPAVKVLRVLTQLLHAEADDPIEHVGIEGVSGCADFVGTLTVRTATEVRTIEFVWDCRWRAEEEGWRDDWGHPDQIRAAREFGWRCFQHWSTRATATHEPATARSAAG